MYKSKSAEWITAMLVLLAAGCSSDASNAPGENDDAVNEQVSSVEASLAVKLTNWHQAMARLALPKKGCFRASYPAAAWEETECLTAPSRPYVPHIVGSGVDFAAAQTWPISSITGSFQNITGLTSESGANSFDASCNALSTAANTYSLQLNTNRFATSVCSGASCKGWQQFLYSNQGIVWMQYWLIGYSGTCPSGWTAFGAGYCYKNSAATSVTTQSITNLGSLTLTGSATSGGQDRVTFATGSGSVFATASDSVLGLAPSWNSAEFNVVGDGCGSQAVFNSGATIGVKLAITNGTSNSPICQTGAQFSGYTGESNNLNLVPSSGCPFGGTSPALQFVQTNASNVRAPFCLLNDLSSFQYSVL